MKSKWGLKIAKVLLVFFLKGQLDCSERDYAFLHNMACSRRLEGIEK